MLLGFCVVQHNSFGHIGHKRQKAKDHVCPSEREVIKFEKPFL